MGLPGPMGLRGETGRAGETGKPGPAVGIQFSNSPSESGPHMRQQLRSCSHFADTVMQRS